MKPPTPRTTTTRYPVFFFGSWGFCIIGSIVRGLPEHCDFESLIASCECDFASHSDKQQLMSYEMTCNQSVPCKVSLKPKGAHKMSL